MEQSADTRVSALEKQLAYTLSQVEGAGAVTVQITVNDLGRKEYARVPCTIPLHPQCCKLLFRCDFVHRI